jgi:hypothetical protein
MKPSKGRARSKSGSAFSALSRGRRGPWLASAVFVGLALLSLLERVVWVGALLSEMRLWLALLALLAGAIITFRGERIAGAATLLVALALGLPSVSLFRSTRPTPQAGPLLRVAHLHAAGVPLTLDDLGQWLSGLGGADVVALSGLSGLGHFPRRIAGFDVHAEASPVLFLGPHVEAARFPSDPNEPRSVSLAVGKCRVRVVAVDLPSRFDRTAVAKRAEMLTKLAHATPIVRSIWIGHLGSRVEATDIAGLLEAQQLRDSRRGHGLLATAPAVLGPLGLPLDHVLVHGWVGVRERSVEAGATPDTHRTVRATLELTEPRCRP